MCEGNAKSNVNLDDQQAGKGVAKLFQESC